MGDRVPRGAWVRIARLAAGAIAARVFVGLWMSSAVPQRRPHCHLASAPTVHNPTPVIPRIGTGFPQGCTSSFPQGAADGINGMHSVEPLPANATAAELSVRLRAVGQLADRLEDGADPKYVTDLARAIVGSLDNLTEEQPA